MAAVPGGQRAAFGLTAVLGTSPRRTAATLSTAIAVIACIDSQVTPAMCCVSVTFGNPSNGLSDGSGSVSNTSRAAPEIQPSFRAVARAASSKSGPREVLIRYEDGFIDRSTVSLTRWCVDGKSGA